MSTRNDIERKASMFTMNGLVDPRLMPDAVVHQTTSRPGNSNTDAFGMWRGMVQRLFGRVSKGNAGL
ncbi:hypothetical protein [Chryseolinea soli]|uniref:Uncharacterized protein n=1 Tax=Chryseolinea soli TaxID=2321403 RepID=A0A385SIB5_9BACT|nr:hypothetical protein [Chryseolinea soli]AYB29100.1 hypothetical protein D4L85_00220 [Chryseolinea soli]